MVRPGPVLAHLVADTPDGAVIEVWTAAPTTVIIIYVLLTVDQRHKNVLLFKTASLDLGDFYFVVVLTHTQAAVIGYYEAIGTVAGSALRAWVAAVLAAQRSTPVHTCGVE